MNIRDLSQKAKQIKNNIENVILGKSKEIDLVLAALLTAGHVLIDDVPGTGKTMLAKTLALSLDCSFSRVQFTPDLLPTDLTGTSIYNPKTTEFSFRKGSLFTNIFVADEINRASPRTQSGLLECMEENQISSDGTTYKLAPPFFVLATQNPVDTQGTYPLPEAQLDRFLIKLFLGYPKKQERLQLLSQYDSESYAKEIKPVCSVVELLDMQQTVKKVFVHKDLIEYIDIIVEQTREHRDILLGVSTRGSIALMCMSKSYAAIQGRDYVIPDDIQLLVPYVLAHRIILPGSIGKKNDLAYEILKDILTQTQVPMEDFSEYMEQ